MSKQIDLFDFVDQEYIQPELKRRRSLGKLAEDFEVRECLIKIPVGKPPIVQFNKEFGWQIKSILAPGIKTVEEVQPIYLHDVVGIEEIVPPTVNGKRVTFIYLFWNGLSYTIIVDPYHSEFMDRPFDKAQAHISRHLLNYFNEMAMKNAKNVSEKLHKVGLWPATVLFSYGIAKIVERIGSDDPEGARKFLIAHCDIDFLDGKIVKTLHPVATFHRRAVFFEDALFCHSHERYHGAVSILVDQIEGVITDWLFDIGYYQADKPRSLKQKIDDFKNALDQIPDLLWMYRESRNAMLRFLTSEPWLQRFKQWNQSIDTSFPGRHVVQHGKYDPDVYSQENSIKLFLLHDTICQFMMFYEVRVLGRDLGQNESAS